MNYSEFKKSLVGFHPENVVSTVIFVDGSCNPNPNGDIGIGVVIYEAVNFSVKNMNSRKVKSEYSSIKIIKTISYKIEKKDFKGETSNNVAEQIAINEALSYAHENMPHKIHIFSDSELAVKQLNGEYRINEGKAYYSHAIKNKSIMDKKIKDIRLIWIPRELNQVADALTK